jgi:hypothetical protein
MVRHAGLRPQDDSPAPINAPMKWTAVVFLSALIAATCSRSESPSPMPTAPTAATTPADPSGSRLPLPRGPNTLSGVVAENASFGGQPLAGVFINAWIDTGAVGYSYWFARGPVVTDAAGRYQMSGLPESATAWVQAWKDDRRDYVQQCAAPGVTLHGDVIADIQLVSKAHLSAVSSSISMSPPGTRSVSGVVFKTGAEGREPVAGAFVAFEPVGESIAADTMSDAAGRYLLCGLPEMRTVRIGACLQPCSDLIRLTVPPGQSSDVDIELK